MSWESFDQWFNSLVEHVSNAQEEQFINRYFLFPKAGLYNCPVNGIPFNELPSRIIREIVKGTHYPVVLGDIIVSPPTKNNQVNGLAHYIYAPIH